MAKLIFEKTSQIREILGLEKKEHDYLIKKEIQEVMKFLGIVFPAKGNMRVHALKLFKEHGWEDSSSFLTVKNATILLSLVQQEASRTEGILKSLNQEKGAKAKTTEGFLPPRREGQSAMKPWPKKEVSAKEETVIELPLLVKQEEKITTITQQFCDKEAIEEHFPTETQEQKEVRKLKEADIKMKTQLLVNYLRTAMHNIEIIEEIHFEAGKSIQIKVKKVEVPNETHNKQ